MSNPKFKNIQTDSQNCSVFWLITTNELQPHPVAGRDGLRGGESQPNAPAFGVGHGHRLGKGLSGGVKLSV